MHKAVQDLFESRNFALIAGPCVIESYELCSEIAQKTAEICANYGVSYLFKASFDKANRTSLSSFRGPGMEKGLEILARIKSETGLPIVTDIHLPEQAAPVAEVVDVLQIPAFLCRQTDLLAAAAATGLPTNIKKGQFLAPEDMRFAVNKFKESGGKEVSLTERGSSFGYHNLVVDMRGLVTMREVSQVPIIFDATHSVQRPAAANGITGGDREMAPVLARAAAAVGIDGLFCEVHPDPDKALSDAANTLTFALLERVLKETTAIRKALEL
ncbi:3-deoxy-8-phosphooctulonate synthase [Myxococcota bacterium]|nr:3-deoxy-8-phosphooctulonate synthase [Myxococcota bacterium]